MTITCTLCGQIIHGSILTGPDALTIGADPDALEFQAAVQQLAGHLHASHAQHLALLQGTANMYLMHLVAKLGASTDPKFHEQQEAGRALNYWTLAGDVQFAQAAQIQPQKN